MALLALGCLAISESATRAEEIERDPTEPLAGIVTLERSDQPLDTQAPPSQFNIPDGAEVWRKASARARASSTENSGGLFNVMQLLGYDFRYAKNFRSERDNNEELEIVIEAQEAVRREKEVHLKQMRITHYITKSPFVLQKKSSKGKGDATDKHSKSSSVNKSPDNVVLPEGLPYGGRIVITAPQAVIDLATNEGRATNVVTMTVYPKPEPGKPETPLAIISTDRLNWRTWREPSIGADEIVLYNCSAKPDDPDPLVTARFMTPQSDGTTSITVIEGQGMIYESGAYDKQNIVYDDDWRTAGRSKVERNRVIFRRNVRLETTATTMSVLLPFQPTVAASGNIEQKKKPKLPSAPVPPSRTVVTCAGPAIFDLAAVPRVKQSVASPDAPVVTDANPAQDPATLRPVLLGRRFEFLNDVRLIKTPVDSQGREIAGERTDMHCKCLRIQYPSDSMPGAGSFPDYAEAVGGITISGMQIIPSASGTVAPPQPFSLECQRMFYDNLNDNLFLVGTAEKPAQVKSSKGEASAQQFNYRSRAEAFIMPASGPKRLIIYPAQATPALANHAVTKLNPADPPVEAMSFGNEITIITLRGTLTRERKLLPVPQGPPRIREVLLLKDDVNIEQPKGGLKLRGNKIQLMRDLPLGEVDFLDGEGVVNVTMNELQATGETFSVDMKSSKPGESQRKLITVTGSRKNETKATLFKGGSAIRADKFLIETLDGKTNNFRALGGAVAVFNAPPTDQPATATIPSPAASKSDALIKGISFQTGAKLMLQCDGEFSQDQTGKVTIRKNVILRQPDFQLLADDVFLIMDDRSPTVVTSKATSADDLFSGNLKTIECVGNVELTTSDQVVQCDRLLHNVQNETSALVVDDPENDVRIYLADSSGGTRFMSVQKNLNLDGKTGAFKPGGMLLMLPYREKAPASRRKEDSPVQKKKVSASKS
ncbi:MAG: hypothetical protein V1899_02675 [Planctomycetota bacterium]